MSRSAYSNNSPDWAMAGFSVFILAVVLFVGALLFCIVESAFFYTTEKRTGIVVDLNHSLAHDSDSSGYVMGTDGKTHYVITTNHEDEKWGVVLRDGGMVYTADVQPARYYELKRGQTVSYDLYKGRWTHFQCGVAVE